MRDVLFLCAETFPSHYAFLGAVFNNILRKRGYRFHWIMPSKEVEGIETARWSGNQVWLIPKLTVSGLPGLVAGYSDHVHSIQRAAQEVLDETGSLDAVQVRDDPAMAYVGWRLARRLQVPFIYQVSHFKEEEHLLYARMGFYGSRVKNYLKGRVGLLLRNWLLRRADLVFPISTTMKESLTRYGIPRERMVALPEGVDASLAPKQFQEPAGRLRRKLGLEDRRVLVYVGTMSRFRQLDFVLRVLARLGRSSPDVHLLMVGDGMAPADLSWLRGKADELGVREAVTFTGRVPRSEVPVYICASDVGLSPVPPNAVYVNSSPIKILEYLALGICCVASDIPSQRHIMEESQAGFCVPHQEARFAEAVEQLLDLADEERRRMGTAGRRYVTVHRDFHVLADVAREAYRTLRIG